MFVCAVFLSRVLCPVLTMPHVMHHRPFHEDDVQGTVVERSAGSAGLPSRGNSVSCQHLLVQPIHLIVSIASCASSSLGPKLRAVRRRWVHVPIVGVSPCDLRINALDIQGLLGDRAMLTDMLWQHYRSEVCSKSALGGVWLQSADAHALSCS
jgi:hypothetical protein